MRRALDAMKYPKLTTFFGLVAALIAWVWFSGIEADWPVADLSPATTTPGSDSNCQ